MQSARALTAGALLMVAGCGGFHSNQPATQVYTLDPVYAPSKAEAAGSGAEPAGAAAAGGSGSGHRAHCACGAVRSGWITTRASRWPAPLPDFLQSLAIEALRASGKYRSVQSDRAAFAADQVLQIEIRRFQAEYAGEGAPVVHVQLLATLGHRNDRSVLASVSAESSVPAAENRMQSVVAAFQKCGGGGACASSSGSFRPSASSPVLRPRSDGSRRYRRSPAWWRPCARATANPCSISSAPGPTMCTPTTFSSGPDRHQFHQGLGLARRDRVKQRHKTARVDLDRLRRAGAGPPLPKARRCRSADG